MRKQNQDRARTNNNRRPRRRRRQRVENIERMATRIQNHVTPLYAASTITFPFVPIAGINGVSPSIVFACAENGMLWSIGGATWSTTTFTNAVAYASIFTEYRIMEFSIELFCAMNTVSAPYSISSGQFLPNVYAVVDREDASALTSAYESMQYASVEVTQLGSVQGPKKIVIKGPAAAAAYDNANSLVGTISTAGATRSPWLSCGTNSSPGTPAVIPHGYVKYYIDPLGSTLSTSMCAMTFIFKAIFEFRGID